MNICTIIAKNYMAHARVLSESFKEHHPDGTSFVLVIDEVESYIDAEEPFELVTAADLNIDNYEHMAEIYDVLELSTAVKPWLLSHLLNERGLERVAYFDPDIRIYDRLDRLNQLTREYELVLIPHVTSPIPRDGKKPSEADILIAGTYNLGFIALERGPRTDKLLGWWSERLKTDCVVAPELGYFVDQRWIDLIHGVMPDFYVLNDPSYNVAYWNLHGRELTNKKGRYYVNGEPLRFFHFSGFDPHHRDRLSKHQNRIELRRRSALARICDEYANALLEHGYNEVKDWPYTYGMLPNGVRLSPGMRRLYRAGTESGELKDSIFALEGANRFVTWLNEPAPVGGEYGVTRYLYEIYSKRADLRRAFPNLDGPDAARFIAWGQTHGDVALPIAHHPSVELNRNHTTDGSPTGVNVVGYFHSELGVGEVARQMTAALKTQNVPVATVGLVAENNRQGHPYETDKIEPIFPINLICVNADMLPEVVTHTGSQLFKDRYSIGMWWWEINEFPERFVGSFKHLNEVWVGSHHVADAIASISPIPVVKMTLPVSMAEIKAFDRSALGLPEGFVFLFVFDYNSVFERKNPLALVEAFKKAFPPGSKASLVLKSINGDKYPEKHESLFRATEDHPDIYVIDSYVSVDEKNAMMAACDCYVSLHRSEGFGITLAEAMYLEKPVIGTAYSGNLDFMTERNSYLVDYELRPVGQGSDPYPPTGEWADPDVEHAASLMRHVFENREEARERGRRAAAEICRTHSPEVAARAMVRRLKYIEAHQATAPGTSYTPRPIGNTKLVAELIAHTPSPVATESLLGRIAGRVRQVVLRLIWPFAMQQRTVNDHLFAMIKNLDANLEVIKNLDANLEALRAQMDDASVELKRRGIEIEALYQAKRESNLEDSVPTRQTLYLGHPFVYPADSIIGKEFIAQGKEWEPVLRTLVSALLPTEEPIICEVGSNIGASLLQILAGKPHARILAFEPSTRFLPFLERNLTLAGVSNVEVSPFFLGKEAGLVCLYNNATTASAVSENYDGHEPRGQQLTEVTTLDEVLRGREQRVDFLKVDTDGYDFEVLRGAETILRRDRPILFFELATYLLPSDPTADLAWLQSLGYQRFACINPGTGQLIGVTEELDQVLAWSDTTDYGYCDVLVCHEGSVAQTHLENLGFGQVSSNRTSRELQNTSKGDPPLPSPQEVSLVTGTEDVAWFLETGKKSAQIIRVVLRNSGLAIEDFDSILDFGCGLGRNMRHWNTLEKTDLHGSDYNPDLIAWCRENLTFAEFQVNGLEDKLQYEDEKFDLIYAWSVFTHLTELLHLHWIEELSRALRPGGHLLFTTHGESYLQHYWESYQRHLLGSGQGEYLQHMIDTHGEEFLQQPNPLSQEQRERFRNGQLVVLGENVAGSNQCNAFHTEQYVHETLAKGLTVVDFVPGGAGASHQDLYVLRKP